MAESLLGVDLAPTRVRVARMNWPPLRKPEFLGFAEAAIDPNEDVPYVQRAVAAVHAALGRKPSGGAKIGLAVPGDRVALRTFTLPFKGKKQVALTAAGEFEQYVPFDLEEMQLDYQILGEEAKVTRVLGAAVHREYLREYVEAFKSAGLDPAVVTVAPLGLVHLLSLDRERPTPRALIDVGERLCAVAILGAEGPLFLRSISFGTRNIVLAIAKELGIDEREAAETMGHALLSDATAAGEAAVRALEGFTIELRTTLFAFRARHGAEVAQVELTGLNRAPDAPADLGEWLSDRLGVQISPFHAPEGMAEVAPGGDAARYTVAAGLALGAARSRDINFRRGDFAYAGGRAQYRGLLIYFGVMGLLILALAGRLWYSVGASDADVVAAEKRVNELFRATFPHVTKVVSPVEQATTEVRELKRRIEVLAPKMGGGFTPLGILRELSVRIPPNVPVDVTELQIDERRIRINGITDTSESFSTLHKSLQDVPQFEKVEIFKSDRVGEGKVSFELRISMRDDA
ncbi:MAG: pilus assembly protein PilM [Myxococcales bacterium]|nr:pilus assembly protein PilM [Myxococcales bacterium]